jgi:hypothetical protein
MKTIKNDDFDLLEIELNRTEILCLDLHKEEEFVIHGDRQKKQIFKVIFRYSQPSVTRASFLYFFPKIELAHMIVPYFNNDNSLYWVKISRTKSGYKVCGWNPCDTCDNQYKKKCKVYREQLETEKEGIKDEA